MKCARVGEKSLCPFAAEAAVVAESLGGDEAEGVVVDGVAVVAVEGAAAEGGRWGWWCTLSAISSTTTRTSCPIISWASTRASSCAADLYPLPSTRASAGQERGQVRSTQWL